jgi:hypothetical protein
MTNRRWQDIDIRWLAVLASLAVSLYTLLLPDIPNDDAYVYMRTAEIYLAEGLAAALEHYSWPAYPVLIAEISRLGLSTLNSALLINALFFALLVYAFISIVQELDNRRSIAMLAAITILLYPELNEFRYMVIRDVGFWALGLLAIWQYLQFTADPRSRHAAGFTLALILATLFRVEAIAWLALMPLALFLDSRFDRQKALSLFLRFGLITWGSLILVLMLCLLAGFNPIMLGLNFLSVYLPFIESTFNPDPATTTELGRLLFGEHGAAFSAEYMSAVIMTGLLVILVMTIFYGISGAYFWLLAYGAWKHYWNMSHPGVRALFCFAAINFLILFVFLYFTRFLSSRYAIPLCLIVVTQLPFVILRILDYGNQINRGKLVQRLLLLFFVFCAFDAYISFGRSKDYLQDSVDYVMVHRSGDEGLLTNNHNIAWHSGMIDAYDEVPRLLTARQLLDSEAGDYLVLEMIHEIELLLQTEEVAAGLEFVTAFPSESEQRVAIYRRLP